MTQRTIQRRTTGRWALRALLFVCVSGLSFAGISHSIASASVPPTTPLEEPVEGGGVVDVPSDQSTSVPAPTNTVPASCFIPTRVQATFVGSLSASDRRTARFEIVQMRGGSLDGYSANNLVDVQYEEDVRYLELEQSYIVAVGIDQSTGALYSKIRDPEPLYGGSQVVGLNSGVKCPEVEDAVRTLTMDARSVVVLRSTFTAGAVLARRYLTTAGEVQWLPSSNQAEAQARLADLAAWRAQRFVSLV